MAPEFSSLVGGSEIDITEMEFINSIFAESIVEDNLRACLIEEIYTVIE